MALLESQPKSLADAVGDYLDFCSDMAQAPTWTELAIRRGFEVRLGVLRSASVELETGPHELLADAGLGIAMTMDNTESEEHQKILLFLLERIVLEICAKYAQSLPEED